MYNTQEYANSILGTRKKFYLGCINTCIIGTVLSTHEIDSEIIYVVRDDGDSVRFVGANSPHLNISDPE